MRDEAYTINVSSEREGSSSGGRTLKSVVEEATTYAAGIVRDAQSMAPLGFCKFHVSVVSADGRKLLAW